MRKPVSVSARLHYLESQTPMLMEPRHDLLEMAESLRSEELEAFDRAVIERLLDQLLAFRLGVSAWKAGWVALEDELQALAPDYQARLEPVTDFCPHCGEPFQPRRSDARYCSTRCRVAAKRIRDREAAAVTLP